MITDEIKESLLEHLLNRAINHYGVSKPHNDKPCLEENWFVEDMLESSSLSNMLPYFDKDSETALRKIYRVSRAIRIERFFATGVYDKFDPLNVDIIGFIKTLKCVINISSDIYDNQKMN